MATAKKRNYYINMISSDKIKKNLGSKIKKLRNFKELTQEQLAEIIDMQPQSISFIETGRTFISSEVLANLCNYFNVEPDFFFTSKNIELSDKEIDLKKEINRLLSSCDTPKLKEIYNIITAIK